MKRTTSMVALALVPVLAGTVACSKKKDKDAAGGTPTPSVNACAGLLKSDAKAKLPAGFPALAGEAFYDESKQGATTVLFGRVTGTADQLVAVRDQITAALTAKHYKIEGTDQEPGNEADAEFSGPHAGTVNVRLLCTGNLVVRYRFEK